MADVNDGTGAGLLVFLEWAGSRGEVNSRTAGARAVAVRKVLAVEGAPIDSVDIRKVDVEDLLERWETLNRTRYSTETLGVYRSRFRMAVKSYLAWLDKRPDWKSAGRRRLVVKKRSPEAGNGASPKEQRGRVQPTSSSQVVGEQSDGHAAHDVATPPVTPMIPYDVPLRTGGDLRARLVLPADLTRADARRLSRFIESLAFDSDQSPPLPPAEGS
jgi:hypothetical protein